MAGIPPSRVDPLELEGEVKSAGDRDRAEEIFQKESLGGRIGLAEINIKGANFKIVQSQKQR